MRVRLIDGLNCTPMVFGEKLRSRKLTVPVLETVGAHEVRLCAEFALGYSEPRRASRAPDTQQDPLTLADVFAQVVVFAIQPMQGDIRAAGYGDPWHNN